MVSLKLKQLKLNWLILVKYTSRHKKNFMIFTVIILLLFFGVYKLYPILSASRALSEGVVGTYQEHDIPEVVLNLISDPLVDVDPTGHAVANLVSGWQANEDETEYTFKLKDNLFWSDGSKVASSDININIPDVEVSFPDPATLKFKLKGAYAPFPSLLTKPIFKKNTLIGVGPYQIMKVEKSRIFITKLILRSQDKSLPSINIRFYPNEKTALTAFNLGEVQALLGVSDQQLADKNPQSASIQKTIFNKIVLVLYNTKDPLLSNRSFRQALSYSTPEVKGEVLAKTSIPPASWAFSSDINDYLDNQAGAKAALGRAQSASSKELMEKELILTTTPQFESLGRGIVTAWQALGVKAVLRVESGIPQNFQALLIAQSIPPDPDQYSLWHSTQVKTNLTGYDSKRVDKDLEDGRKISKPEDRAQKYVDFQKQLLEDSPATFLYFPKYNVLYLKKVDASLTKVLPMQLPK